MPAADPLIGAVVLGVVSAVPLPVPALLKLGALPEVELVAGVVDPLPPLLFTIIESGVVALLPDGVSLLGSSPPDGLSGASGAFICNAEVLVRHSPMGRESAKSTFGALVSTEQPAIHSTLTAT